jgi:P-type Cu+ transporter
MLRLDTIDKNVKPSSFKSLYYKIGIAGFAFGNIMLLSFPEYLGFDRIAEKNFSLFIGLLMTLLAIPVLLYSSSVYFISAYKGIRNKIFNIDVPLSLGIFVLFVRSLWEVATQTGAGYYDSFSGLVFFLLAGKLFQSKTYDTLNFERNYKSYFPLSVTVLKEGKETTIPVDNLKTGDRVIIRNNELIPADAILFKGEASIDYSFVSGESLPVSKVLGEIIHAGGRQCRNMIELEVVKEVSQSYLTQLWNNSIFEKEKENKISENVNIISKYFTFVVLAIAVVSGLYWLKDGMTEAINVFTAVLIVACPCALALSVPFTFGNTMRIFGKAKFYLKNSSVIEKLSKINTVIFDKTGTITKTGDVLVKFFPPDIPWGMNLQVELTELEKIYIKALTQHSNHILSRKIFEYLNVPVLYDAENYEEHQGEGIKGIVENNEILLGSDTFVFGHFGTTNFLPLDSESSSRVYVAINDRVRGYFGIKSLYREGLEGIVNNLNEKYEVHIISGDNDSEKEYLTKFFNSDKRMRFRQQPQDKLNYIKSLQKAGKKVLMVGDGLNDAGALQQSDMGITVSDSTYNFSPACDGILDASAFKYLDRFIKFSKFSMKVIIASFIFSLVYNIIGLSFAINAKLSPIVAAILMPVSSISVVLFSVLMTNLYAYRQKLFRK